MNLINNTKLIVLPLKISNKGRTLLILTRIKLLLMINIKLETKHKRWQVVSKKSLNSLKLYKINMHKVIFKQKKKKMVINQNFKQLRVTCHMKNYLTIQRVKIYLEKIFLNKKLNYNLNMFSIKYKKQLYSIILCEFY